MKGKFIALIGISSLFISQFFLTQQALASEYPKSRIEKEMDEMGSLIGGEGIVFKPKKEKSTATKAVTGNINKYLYQAAIETLKFAPLASTDSIGGTVITEWYTPQGQKNVQFKIIVYIKEQLITPEAIDVVAFQRKKSNGSWDENHEHSPIATELEDKIIRKARELYLQSCKK